MIPLIRTITLPRLAGSKASAEALCKSIQHGENVVLDFRDNKSVPDSYVRHLVKAASDAAKPGWVQVHNASDQVVGVVQLLAWMNTSINVEVPKRHGRDMKVADVLANFKDGDELGWDREFAYLRAEKAREIARLTVSIATNGQHSPITLGDDGRVWDGHHRLCAIDALGIETVLVVDAS